MDFGHTRASKLTDRIMRDIRVHLKADEPGESHSRPVYEAVKRHVLADHLVDNLARKMEARR